jgi:hypothetical protein
MLLWGKKITTEATENLIVEKKKNIEYTEMKKTVNKLIRGRR